MFAIATGLMLATVIIVLSYPFWYKTEAPVSMSYRSAADQEQIDLEIEKEVILTSLSELDIDLAQERLTEKDYQRLKATDEYRLFQILTKLDRLTKEGPPLPQTKKIKSQSPSTLVPYWTTSVLLSLMVVGSASAIYYYLHWRQNEELQAVQRETGQGMPSRMPNPQEMVARLEQRLRTNPNDLQGQVMAGRSYMTMQRTEDAKKAWSKVLELDSRNYEAHFNLGIILLQTRKIDDPKIFEEALNHFDTALAMVPMEPAILWWKGVALVHLKRYTEAEGSWTAAFQNLAPGSEDSKFVKQALQNLRDGKPPLF